VRQLPTEAREEEEEEASAVSEVVLVVLANAIPNSLHRQQMSSMPSWSHTGVN
jgi:hypothetical protein